MVILQSIGLFLAGILAGVEFIVRYGVQPALSRLDDVPHIRARQAIIGRLRIVVPLVMIPTVVVTIAVLVVALVTGQGDRGLPLVIAGLAALVVVLLASFLGTVPINIKVYDWDAAAPPADWKSVIRSWERIDVLRSSAAMVAFALLVGALALH